MSGRNSFKAEELPQQVGECKCDMGEGKVSHSLIRWNVIFKDYDTSGKLKVWGY